MFQLVFILLTISFFAACAVAAPPTAFNRRVDIFLDSTAAAARSDKSYFIPELLDDGLTISVDKYNEIEYKLCLKRNVAAPVAAGTQNWETAHYCELFHFTNATQTMSVDGLQKRAVAAHLRGFGHSRRQRAVMGLADGFGNDNDVAVEAGYVAKATGNGGVQTKNIASGAYWLTVAAVKPQKANATLSLVLSGTTCGAGKFENKLGQCVAYAQFGGHAQFKKLAPFESVLTTVTAAAKIGSETGSLTLTANIVNGDKTSSGQVLLRHAAPPVAGANATFDFHVEVSGDESKTTVITAPSIGDWYLAAWNTGNATTIDLNVTLALKQCTNHTMGANCDAKIEHLLVPGTVNEQAKAKVGEPLYFRFHRNDTATLTTWLNADADEVPASLAIAVAALGKGTVKKPVVNARIGQLPTKTQFDVTGCTVKECNKFQDSLVVPQDDVVDEMQGKDWFVVVVPQDDAGVAVWNAAGGVCAEGCAEHGTCNKHTAICECPEDFSSYDCALPASNLSYWEWVFIIGGCILAAICLVGCIIYFIQKQQRRAGFERV